MEYSEDEKILMDYLDGNLEAAGLQVLENRLLRETKLKQKLALYEWGIQSVRVEAIRNLVAQSQRDFLSKRVKEDLGAKRSKATTVTLVPTYTKWVGIAASILLFMALSAFLFLNSISGADLFQDKFLSYEISSFRGDVEAQSRIQDLYRAGDFEAVLAAASNRELEDLSKDDLLLLAISALAISEPQQALSYLDILQQKNALDQSGELQDERDFYAALAHIQMENFTEGYTLISHITEDTAHKYNKNFPLGYRTKIKMLSLIK